MVQSSSFIVLFYSQVESYQVDTIISISQNPQATPTHLHLLAAHRYVSFSGLVDTELCILQSSLTITFNPITLTLYSCQQMTFRSCCLYSSLSFVGVIAATVDTCGYALFSILVLMRNASRNTVYLASKDK